MMNSLCPGATSMKTILTTLLLFSGALRVLAEETLPPLKDGKAPETFAKQLFWENKEDDPGYRPTTDWGHLAGFFYPRRYQDHRAPQRQLDPVDSPRNSSSLRPSGDGNGRT